MRQGNIFSNKLKFFFSSFLWCLAYRGRIITECFTLLPFHLLFFSISLLTQLDLKPGQKKELQLKMTENFKNIFKGNRSRGTTLKFQRPFEDLTLWRGLSSSEGGVTRFAICKATGMSEPKFENRALVTFERLNF